MKDTKDLLHRYAGDMVATRRRIHQNPELSGREFKTTELIREFLRNCEIEIMDTDLKTGCIGLLKGGKPGKIVGLREDIDALPITEETNLPFASENEGVMHACGHDIHQTVLLYTAKVLSEIRDELCGSVLFLFQPAEENLSGALQLLNTKFYAQFKPDVLLGLHCSPEYDAGTIGVKRGAANASSDFLKIIVSGVGGHGAHPENVIDPIMASAFIITELQTVISRVNHPVHPAVLTLGSIHGGTAGNVVPSSVEMIGTLRSLNEESRRAMQKEIERIVSSGASALRCTGTVEWTYGMPPLVNDEKVIDAVVQAADKMIGKDHIVSIPYPSMGSDDFSWLFPEICPGAQFRLGTGNDSDPNTRRGLHNAKNVFDEEALHIGAEVLIQFVRDFLA